MATSPIHASDLGELLTRAVRDVRELLSAEIALAKREIRSDARASMKAVAILCGVAFLLSFGAAFALLSLLLGLGATPDAAGAIAASLATIGTLLGIAGWSKLPRDVLPRTEKRIKAETKDIGRAVTS